MVAAPLALAACTPDVFVGTSSGMGGGGAASSSSILTSSSADTTGAMSSGTTTGGETSSTATSSAATSSASSLMMVGFCGDGMLDPAETCDDGNTAPNDGCSTSCAIEGATCTMPIDVSVPPGEMTIVGSTSFGLNTPGSGCASAPGAERWFRFHPTTDGFLTVWTDPSGTSFDATVYTMPGCASAPKACGDNVQGAPDVLSFKVAANADILIAIDGPTSGPFKLKIDLSDGDDCSDPIPLPIGPAGSLPTSVIADTTAQGSDNTSGMPPTGCGGASAPDMVYEVRPMGAATVTVQGVGAASMAPVLYNRPVCTDPASGMCGSTTSPGGTATFMFAVGATPTFLWVDGYIGTSGQVNLSVDP